MQGDATSTIQAAIDQVSGLPLVNGFRGAVLIEAGYYEVSSPLSITASGVVIRGQGSSSIGGTTIQFTSTLRETDTFVFGNEVGGITTTSSTIVDVTDTFVPSGAKTISVTSTTGYAVGQQIIIKFQPNQDWIDQLSGMGQYGW